MKQEGEKPEAIAIIGLGCRFPRAKNPEEFWQLLRQGVDAITEVPAQRWPVESLYEPTPAVPGKMNTRWGGFLEEVDQFDPSFFGISPREAERIDPQQRLLLEVAWEALENAGLIPAQLSGSQTGVFIGISNNDYGRLLAQDLANINAYNGTGNAFCIAANRISYFLNLKGPSLAIDTACSSSLVALHYACQSLYSGESNLCLVGGVNIILSPELTITFSQARMMAADGRCKTFDERADGYVRGEGCGVVVLKRLSDALRDGDNIRAIIRGTAINQDGLTNGITAPNGPSQQAVIRQALKNAGVAPSEISYVEAHGTGTPLGDPQEFKSLKEVLMAGRQPDQSCWLGSVKTNIGHLESAAGIAGLIKTVLSLQHREIPPHLHLQQLNRYISLEGIPLTIPVECQPWDIEGKRLAGVSSFGFGGTNCHVILEEGRRQKAAGRREGIPERPLHLLALAAKNEIALRELAQVYQTYLQVHPEVSIADVCFSANTGRSHFEQRLAVIAESSEQLQEKLQDFVVHREGYSLVTGKVNSRKSPKVAFLFTGQGSQYGGMARELYETQPTFRSILDHCAEILSPYLDIPLLDIIYPEKSESRLHETVYTQPALFALEYALAQLWMSWGVKPDVVMGHSLGEYVAACVAGVFSLEEGLKLIAHRGRLMQQLPATGKMVAVIASEPEIEKIIAPYSEQISIAAINGPQSLVISGEAVAIEDICQKLEAQGIKTKPLQVSHAFHSPLMEPMLAEFATVTAQVRYHTPKIPIISNVTGKQADESITRGEYWLNHVREPVRFAQSIETLSAQGVKIFLEIGAKPILLGMGRQCLPEDERLWLPSLRPPQADWQQMLASLGQLYVEGVKIDWRGFEGDYSRRKVEIPTYPFQRQRYWFEPSPSLLLLKMEETEQLAQHLTEIGEFSENEVKLLTKLLAALANHQQTQRSKSSTKNNGRARTTTRNVSSLETVSSPPQPVLRKAELLAADPEKRLHLLRLYLGKLLAKVSGISPAQLKWDDPLSSLGIDSLMATELRKRLETDLEVTIPVEFLAGLSLNQFLQQILSLLEGKASSESEQFSNSGNSTENEAWFPTLQPNSSARFRLFCLPYAGGGASIFQSWVDSLSPDIEICPIQLPGRETRLSEVPFKRLKPLIETLTSWLCPYLDRPYAFFGYSLGAILGFELTRQLRLKKAPTPACLFVAASRAPQIPDFDAPIHTLADDKFIKALAQFQGMPEALLQDRELMQLYLPTLRADFAMLETYFYTGGEALDCPIMAFGGLEDKKVSQEQLEAWQEQTTGDFTLKMFSGNHFFFEQSEPYLLKLMAEKIQKLLLINYSRT